MNFFFVLYPLGIGCECWLIYHAVPFAMQWSVPYAWFLIANLIIYVPGEYISQNLVSISSNMIDLLRLLHSFH